MTSGYYLFDTSGPTRVPTREQVTRLARYESTVTALVLDANVCLDIASFASGNLAPPDRKRVAAFLGRVKRSGADTVPGFGLAELSLDRVTFALNREKLESFESKITYSLRLPASRLGNRPRFDERLKNEPVDVGMMRPWLPMFQLLYACMLKILALSRGGLARQRALSNVRSFVEWMCSDLNVFAVLPLQAAYAVFGGDGKARKLVGVDSKRDPINCAWGAAWDVFYFQNLFHIKLNPIYATPERYIFVTRDAACYNVFSRCRLFGGLRANLNHTLPLAEIDSDFPHFASKDDELMEIIRPFAMSRISKLVDPKPREHSHFANLIADLEAEFAEPDSQSVPARI